MTDTNVAGAAGSETASVPAPVPSGELSLRDAVNSVLDGRRKAAAAARREDESAEPATPAHESASQEADAASQETETPGETESQADPTENLPPIEPPRSWTKEARERFNSLPRETQEYLVERETERDREVRRSQNEAAETRKAIEAERAQVVQARQQYEQAAAHALASLQAAHAGQFSDIKTMADVERLAVEDPLRYSQWDAQQKKLAAHHAELANIQQQQMMELQQQLTTFINRQNEMFAEKVPEIRDKATREKLTTAAIDVLHDLGFSDQELGQLYRGEANLSLHDHRLQLLIRDGVKYREAQAAAAKVTEKVKPVPPVQRPGIGADKNAARDADFKAREKQLGKLPTSQAIREAARLVVEQRRNAR